MQWTQVDSNMIEAVAYEGTTLHVRMKNGHKEYAYADVPEGVVHSLLSARSKGKFFNEHIRDRYHIV